MKNKIIKALSVSLVLVFTVCISSCSLIEKSDDLSFSKYADLETVSQQLLEQNYANYEYTSVFKSFGDRAVLQLDCYDAAANLVIPYCLIFPKNYNPKTEYPVLTYLHGAGENGNDNNSHLSLMVRYCNSYPQFLNDSFIVCPQCPTGDWWTATGRTSGINARNLDLVMKILDTLPDYCSVDTDRYYVTGVSMGGFGTFNILSAYPNKFAAGVPICGGGNTNYAEKLVDIPLWLFHSRDDNIVSFSGSENMYNAIKAAGGEKINFTILEGYGHSAWDATEHNDELFRWIFYQTKSGANPLDYTFMLEIRDSKNNPIFNEEDFLVSYYSDSGINLILKEDLHSYYQNLTSKKQTLTVFYEGKNIGEIKIEKAVSDGIILFKPTVSKDEAVALCSKI